jgi:UDP-N-acetylmuramyl tripeptide synthase
VVLESIAPARATPAALETWARLARAFCAGLGWPSACFVARPHSGGATLAFDAPVDQLFAATEVNELAWQLASGIDAGLHAPGFPTTHDEAAARRCLALLARAERRPGLVALLEAAGAHGVPFHLDDDVLSLGEGEGSRAWSILDLPAVDAVDWPVLRAIPTAVVTGSNGKTTTVRLLAAMARAHGWHTAHSCTDGLFLDGARIEAGDYSGPVGARTLLRDTRVEAAVLETARGGILRRGLAVRHADVAVVTNVSADHFGEYGIDSLDDLAQTKLAVARVVDARGRLVLNADDPVLVRQALAMSPRERAVSGSGTGEARIGGQERDHESDRDNAARDDRAAGDAPIAWFALDDDHPVLREARARGGATCGYVDGGLWLSHGDARVALGRVDALPLALGGVADYNLANLAGAALAADGLGIPTDVITRVLATFGASSADNPGRLQRWRFGDANVLLDYAHNPEGLDGFLRVATALRGEGRLGLLLGQAGNRPDEDIRALARVAAGFAPARIVLKDIEGFLRGRRPGEVPDVIAAELARIGVPADRVGRELREADAARALLAWMRNGDVLALPVHAAAARDVVVALLDRLQAEGWRPGQALPAALTLAPGTTGGGVAARDATAGGDVAAGSAVVASPNAVDARAVTTAEGATAGGVADTGVPGHGRSAS